MRVRLHPPVPFELGAGQLNQRESFSLTHLSYHCAAIFNFFPVNAKYGLKLGSTLFDAWKLSRQSPSSLSRRRCLFRVLGKYFEAFLLAPSINAKPSALCSPSSSVPGVSGIAFVVPPGIEHFFLTRSPQELAAPLS